MSKNLLVELSSHDEGAEYDRLMVSIRGIPAADGISRIKEFLRIFPSCAMAHNDLGVLYHQNKNSTLSLAHYEKAARLQPDNTLFRKNLADFYAVELGWLEEAVDIYLEVLKRNPRDTEALIALGHLGSAMAGSGVLDAPAGRECLAPVASSTPLISGKTDQDLYNELQQMASCGTLVEARALIDELARRQPQNSKVQNDLGVVCYQLGDIAAAQRFYENAVCLQPDDAIFARNLADLYFVELNRVDDAIQIYLELYRKNPRDVETLINIGHICAAVGRSEEANSFYRRALEIEPWNNDARDGLAGQTRPESQVAEPQMDSSRTAEELVSEARRMVAQGQAVKARDLLEQALAKAPHYAVAHNDLGVVAYSLGDLGVAQVAYEQAVKLQPDNLDFRKNLADLYFVAAGRTDDAIQIYLELFQQFPRDIEVLSALGQICQAVGRPEESKTFFRRVLEIEPWNKEVREALQGQI